MRQIRGHTGWTVPKNFYEFAGLKLDMSLDSTTNPSFIPPKYGISRLLKNAIL